MFLTERCLRSLDMLGGGGVVPGGGYAASGGWCCADVVSSRTGLVLFDVLFNYEALLRSARRSIWHCGLHVR